MSKFPEGARSSSRSNSREFLQPNNSLLSGNTVTTVVPPDPTDSIIHGKECSTNSRSADSSYYNVRYTNHPSTGRMIPHGSHMPQMQQLPSPDGAECAEILEGDLPWSTPTCIIDQGIYNNPSVPQSHVINYNGVRGPIKSSCNSDHQIYCQQQMQQQHQQPLHSRNHSQ